MRINRSPKQDKLARVFDEEIAPIWTSRFAEIALREIGEGPRAMVLDAACATGSLTLELLQRLDEARVIALELVPALLDLARQRAGLLAGKRAFFRSDPVEPRLAFADEVYDLVIANLLLHELDDPAAGLRDLTRVAKHGGQVVATLPLRGTWTEFFDLFREVLLQLDRRDALERLDAHIAELPEPEEAATWMEAAGLRDGRIEVEEYTMLFRSSREFFFAPVVEHGPLQAWKQIAGRGEEMQDVFWHVKEAIDSYFRGRAFAVTVKAGCLSGIRAEPTRSALATQAVKVRHGGDGEVVEVTTGEIERVDLEQTLPSEEDDLAALGGDETSESLAVPPASAGPDDPAKPTPSRVEEEPS